MLHQLHVAAAAFCLVLQTFTSAGETRTFKAPIMLVTESQIAVQQGNESITVLVTKDTTITLDGKSVRVGELKINDTAEVTAVENNDRTFRATVIKATRAAATPAKP